MLLQITFKQTDPTFTESKEEKLDLIMAKTVMTKILT
jgi:hypothetical protein